MNGYLSSASALTGYYLGVMYPGTRNGLAFVRQYVDENAQHEAHHHEGQDLEGEQHLEAVEQQSESFHRRAPSGRTGLRAAPSA